MKKSFTKLQFVLVAITLSSVGLINANIVGAYNTLNSEITSLEAGDDLVGGWTYTVESAPAGYENGFLVITKRDDEYLVQVQVGTGTFLGENVMVKGKEISFNVMIEGGKVALTLTAKGSAITGKATSPEGSYTINGVKSISAE